MQHSQNCGIFIEAQHKGVRAAVVCNNQLQSFSYDNCNQSYPALDNIYFGRVISKSEAGYFVDIGTDSRPGLLPPEKGMPKLKVGVGVHVQVIREPMADMAEASSLKPAKLSQHLTLTGKYCLLAPSRSMPARLSRQARYLDIDLESLPSGTVVREAAAHADLVQITKELEELQSKFEAIMTDEPNKPKLIYRSLNAHERLVRDALPGDDIVVNTPSLAAELKQLTKLDIHINKGNLFVEAGAEDIWAEMFTSVLPLKSGGHITIHETSAGCMIDVNQGSGKIIDANREAVLRAAEQIQLRGIAGNIAIDFIDVVSVNAKKDLHNQMVRALGKHDNARILGWAPSGWLLLRRDRRRQSITDQLSNICPTCHGIGREFNE